MKTAAPPNSVSDLLELLEELRLGDDAPWRDLAKQAPGPFASAVAFADQLVWLRHLTPFQAGELLAGRGGELRLGKYLLLGPLDQGGMGQVYKARHLVMRRIVALKVIRPELLSDAESVRRFRREVELAAQMSHPHIVTAFDAEEAEGRHFLVMELCAGPSLAHLVADSGPLPVGLVCACMRQAALGLQYASEHGLVHRDIKPQNMLVTPSGLKILDFGLARLAELPGVAAKASTGEMPLTCAGQFLGTPDFIAPEQSRDPQAADLRSDLYSLGCTFYFALSGRVPFPGGAFMDKVVRHQIEEPAPLEQLRPDVSAKVAGIVRRLMAKKPGERYQTAAELAAELEPWADKDLDKLQSLTPAPAPSKPTKKRSPAASTQEATDPWATMGPSSASTGEKIPSDTAPPMSTKTLNAPAAKNAGAGPKHSAPMPSRRRISLAAGAVLALVAVISTAFTLWLMCMPPGIAPNPEPSPTQPLAAPGEWKLLHTFSHPTTSVNRVVFSPDGKTLAVACGREWDPPEAMIRVWDVASKTELAKLDRHKHSVMALAFSSDGKTLASAAGNLDRDVPGEVLLWDTERWQVRDSFLGSKNGVGALAFLPGALTLAAAGKDGAIGLWDVAGGKARHQFDLKGHAGAVNAVLFLDGGKKLASAGADQSVRLWDVSTREPATLAPAQLEGWPMALALSPDGALLACVTTGSGGGNIVLWKLSNRELLRPPVEHGFALQAAVFSSDSKLLITGDVGGCRVWDVGSFGVPRLLQETSSRVPALAITPDGGTLAVGRVDNGAVSLWRLR